MASGADFRSRITVDGADKVTSDLKAIGTAGEAAFNTVGKAADTSSRQVTSFGRATDAVARQMASLGNAGKDISEIGKRFSAFGSSLNNAANNIIPRWREILALGTAGGFAGFFKLFEATAQWGKDLAENAKRLGVTPGQLGQIAKAAREAGVDIDKLVTGMTKFGVAMEKAGDEQKKLFGDLAKEVLGANTALSDQGVKVLRGGSAGGPSSAQFVNIPKMEQFREQAEQAYAVLQKMGAIPKSETLTKWLFDVEQKLIKGGDAAAKVTELLNKAGANLPVAKLGAQIDQAMPGFRDLFAQMKIPVFDKATGDMRKFTDVFGDFLDQFAKKSPAAQARVVTETMGRGFLELIPIMQEGRGGLLKFFDAAKAAGVDTSGFDKEIEALDEAQKSLNRLDSSMKAVRKSFVVPFADVFKPITDQLGEFISGSQPEIKAWATGIADQVKTVVLDLRRVFQGAAPQTDFGKFVVEALSAITVAIGVVKAAFQGLTAVMTPLTDVFNSLFGKDYSPQTYALAAALLYFSGILPALLVGLRAIGAALAFMTATPIGLALTALGLIALTIYQNWDKLGPLFKSLWDQLVAFGDWIKEPFVNIWNSAISAVTDLWTSFTNWIGRQVQTIKDYIDSVLALLPGRGGSSAPVATAPIPPSGMAAGGQVPGSGSGDIVPALLTPGEFVIRKGIVDSLGAGFFAALNGGRGSFLPRSRYATGGIVAAAASGGTPVHLHLGGHSFALSGSESVVSSLVTEAHRQRMRSAGTKPSWYGGH